MALLDQIRRSMDHLVDLLFRRQIKLRLRGGLRFEFTAPDGRRIEGPKEQAAAAGRAELAALLGELAQCLDADPDIRPDLRHLAYIETALKQQGLDALDRVPLEVLSKALEQFEGLVSNWSPRGLATLRSKMAVALQERHDDADQVPGAKMLSATTA